MDIYSLPCCKKDSYTWLFLRKRKYGWNFSPVINLGNLLAYRNCFSEYRQRFRLQRARHFLQTILQSNNFIFYCDNDFFEHEVQLSVHCFIEFCIYNLLHVNSGESIFKRSRNAGYLEYRNIWKTTNVI